MPSDALNDVETRLQLLGRATHDAIWDWDLIHDETVWNEALLTLFGHAKNEVGEAVSWWKEKIHSEDRERVVQSIEAVIRSRTRSSWMQEYRFRRADGSYADVLDRGYVMRNAKGEAVRMVGAMQDHTDRKKAEEALRLRDRALEAIGQGVVITDYRHPDNPIIYVNSGFEVLTGYQEQEVLGRNCRFLQGKETDQQQVREIGNALRAGRAHRRSLLNYRKDGTAFVNELTLSPIRDRKGTITHYVGVQSDVTRRTEVEEQLRQAQKMEALGQLTGGIAHDFNNLLTVILGNSELLVDQPNDAELVAGLSRQIMAAAERSSDLTQKLLAFGRRQSLKPQRLNVSGVVTSMVPLLRRTIGAHIELRTELHEGEHTALSDRTLLESALLNLVINARDAMAQGGVLTLTTGERAAGLNEGALPIGQPVVFVTVSDTGEGMTSEVLERVFEPFFTTKEVGKGSGLGLAMVYGFARQTGGHVSIQSTPGEGTAVTVVMPAITSSDQKTAYRDSPVMLSRTRERVLLVEDEPQVLQFASAQLLNLGYDVTAVATGQDALDLIQAGQPFDLLFTDVVLPKGMSGVELSRQAQSVQPNLKVLLTSGYSEEVFQHHGRPEEGTLLLRKPYRRKELAETLRKALEPTHTTDSARPT